MAKEIIRKRNTSICLGCIKEFSNLELTIVEIHDDHGIDFQSAFCEKCVKSKNFPGVKFNIVGPVAKPRKAKVKNETEKITPKKKKVTVKKKKTPIKKKEIKITNIKN